MALCLGSMGFNNECCLVKGRSLGLELAGEYSMDNRKGVLRSPGSGLTVRSGGGIDCLLVLVPSSPDGSDVGGLEKVVPLFSP